MLPFSRDFCALYQDLRDSKGECKGLRSELETLQRRVEEEGTGGDVGSLRAQVPQRPGSVYVVPSFLVCQVFVVGASYAANTTVFAPSFNRNSSHSIATPAVAKHSPASHLCSSRNTGVFRRPARPMFCRGLTSFVMCLGSLPLSHDRWRTWNGFWRQRTRDA